MSKIRKAVIPAAGLGTRLLPATKSIPKEMLPIVDRPAIQYVIDEAVAAGIEDILIITSPSKHSIANYFDRDVELESLLREANKTLQLEAVQSIISMASIHYRRQGEPLGLGHAIGVAKAFVGNDSFAVLLPDDLLVDQGELLTRMIDVHQDTGSIVLAAGEFPVEEVVAYGVIDPREVDGDRIEVANIVEKPSVQDAPSRYGLAPGRYIFPPEIFASIEKTEPGVGGEIQITDAIAAMIDNPGVVACMNRSPRYDAGKKVGYLSASVDLALTNEEFGDEFAEALREIIAKHDLM